MPYYNPHKKIAIFFLSLTFLLFVSMVIFFFNRETKMTIVIKPKLEEDFLEKTIKIPKDLNGEILEIKLSEKKKFLPKVSLEVEDVARGEVEIINNSNKNQTLIKTTRLLSSEGILFRLDHQVVVPAKGKIKATVYADKAGKEGEIEATRFIFPGLPSYLQKLIYAESKEKMTGGVKKIGQITEEEIEEAKKEITELINKKSEEKIQESIKKMGLTLGEWEVILGEKKLEIETDAKIDEKKEEFVVEGKINVFLVFFKKNELFDLIKKIAVNNLSQDKKLKDIDYQTLKYNLKNLNLQEKTADLEIKIKIFTIIKENYSFFDLEKIKMLTPKEIKNYLEQYKEIESVEIYFYPFWKKQTPEKKELIEIMIKEL